MVIIKSISGIRGTIGGVSGDNLTPIDVVNISSAYGYWIKSNIKKNNYTVIIGRDSRISGYTISNLIISTLQNLGINIINLKLSTTPTIEICVIKEKADGGIILTASHNPENWNAIKFIDNNGELISKDNIESIIKLSNNKMFEFVETNKIGNYKEKYNYIKKHIKEIIKLPLVNINYIKNANLKIVVDGINSTGGIAIPMLLKILGINSIVKLHCNPNGYFSHNPEPLSKNLIEICKIVKKTKSNLGIAVDPDVDRLVFICENGNYFGEEYTLVAISDYILENEKGPVVSNLSSSMALKDLAISKGVEYYNTCIGEINVIKKMKEVNAVIGGEGNGGVIYPKLHYGRDALVGIALFLSFLSKKKITVSNLRSRYSSYFMSKQKIQLSNKPLNIKLLYSKIFDKYNKIGIITLKDGIKIDFKKKREWIHLRKSNTEPIMRIYAESTSQYKSNILINNFLKYLYEIMKY